MNFRVNPFVKNGAVATPGSAFGTSSVVRRGAVSLVNSPWF
jgi:hypothetical protein